jgi:hypothetical protein
VLDLVGVPVIVGLGLSVGDNVHEKVYVTVPVFEKLDVRFGVGEALAEIVCVGEDDSVAVEETVDV